MHSVVARPRDVESPQPEPEGQETRAHEVFAALVETQDEGDAHDDPSIAEDPGASGRQSHHDGADYARLI